MVAFTQVVCLLVVGPLVGASLVASLRLGTNSSVSRQNIFALGVKGMVQAKTQSLLAKVTRPPFLYLRISRSGALLTGKLFAEKTPLLIPESL